MDNISPKPRQRRPKDSFQSELQAKLYNRKSQGLTADITDSEEDSQTSPYIKDHASSLRNRPGSAKRRPDRSPDLGRGLGTTTMRSRDLTQLLHPSGDYLDDDDDEEVMAANMGRSNAMNSWQAPGLKTPSPKQDPRYQRKTPTREITKDGSRLDSILGRKTPTRESPKEQGKLDSLYGRKTPTKEASPRNFAKEDLMFGRKTPTSAMDGHQRLPGMDGSKDKPWQPPNFRTVSPNSPSEHSRGSRGVTPTESGLQSIDESYTEKVTPRLQRGDRIRDDESPSRQRSLEDRPIPQSRSKIGDKKSPLFDRKSPQDRKSPFMERKSPLDRKSHFTDRNSPLVDSSHTRDTTGSMKRATPTYDLFGKSRSSAAQEVEDFIQSDKKEDPRYKRGISRSPDGRKTPTDGVKFQDQGLNKDKGKKVTMAAGSRESGRKTPTGKKTPTDFKKEYNGKSTVDKEENLKNRKSPLNKSNSLLDFLTEGSGKSKPQNKKENGKHLDEEIDDMFGSNKKYLSGKSQSDQYKSNYNEQRKSPIDRQRPSLTNKKSNEYERQRSPDHFSKIDREEEGFSRQARRSPEMFESSGEMQKRIPKTRKEDESSVCEEIPLDPNLQKARMEEKALRSGKETTSRAKTNSAIDLIAKAQSMQYIEPAKKIRPVTAEAKVQHRPKPRYGTLPGAKTQTLEREFSSTSDIRDAIYEQWYAERLKTAKIKKKEDEKKKLEEEQNKKKEEKERLKEAEMSYKAWVDKKKETVFRDKAKQRHKEQEKKDQENREKQEKEEEAMKTFKHWKEHKDAMIKHELHNKRKTEEEKQRDKEEEEYKKKKDRESAFRGWQSKKEKDLDAQRRKHKQQKEDAKRKIEEEKESDRYKEEEALSRYTEWMESKEKQSHLEKKRNRQRLISEDDEYRPAWSPASKTIPFGR